ncbi:ABC transporter ATP-binding protein [Candidatus Nitrotoga sp. M5]|uniref:ABC transporter ATP-binding protein n=1 Tax=Candidatus Nitrotoga sp. M5 TaxID=2890409 RepID=UPI001EF3B380|nr:ABC transporter ATP-binding protein [Candidatus Nitrotoga sp. M5]CAH1386230.1 ABC-type polysaccharide/polyol phosphate transport system, ATPase component [Candidatus Nitrotoga sp. M5]
MPIIEVNQVTKEYQLGQLQNMKTTALNQWRRLTGQPIEERAPFKALDDVNFSIEAGEVVGIIGQNGAGKSTMLKLLANISKPSSGSITVKGKVAPLIEVGAGLVGDLTGRENIYLNGAILGIPKAEITRKFDDVVAFAELEEFIDTPVKRYSSGMQVRLGFAIATSVESDILIVDEVLAVGDLAFQRKCFDRMEDLIKGQGKTVLLVSHNIRQVERMCSRAILLVHGKINTDGKSLDVCEDFYRKSNEKVLANQRDGHKAQINSSGEVDILDIEVLNADGQSIQEIASGDSLRVRVQFELKRSIDQLEIIVGTHTTDFLYLSAASTIIFENRPHYDAGQHEVEYLVKSFPLVSGVYCLRVAMFDGNKRMLFSGETLKTFSVAPSAMEVRQPPMRKLSLATEWKLNGQYFGDEESDGA